MAIAKLDMEAGIVRYVHRFSHLSDEIENAQHPDMPDKQSGASLRVGSFQGKKDKKGFKREKNWGFVEEEGALMVYYALLPCTVVLEFDMGQPDGVILRSRACYDNQAAIILQQTGQLVLVMPVSAYYMKILHEYCKTSKALLRAQMINLTRCSCRIGHPEL